MPALMCTRLHTCIFLTRSSVHHNAFFSLRPSCHRERYCMLTIFLYLVLHSWSKSVCIALKFGVMSECEKVCCITHTGYLGGQCAHMYHVMHMACSFIMFMPWQSSLVFDQSLVLLGICFLSETIEIPVLHTSTMWFG